MKVLGLIFVGAIIWFLGFVCCMATMLLNYKVGVIHAKRNVFIPNDNLIKLLKRKTKFGFLEIDYEE